MKKSISAVIAAALMVPMAAPAAARDGRDNGHTVVVKKTTKKWAKGQRFDRRYATNYQVINYGSYRRLSAPPRGYQWVRSGNDAVLIGITSGLVSSVVSGLFN